METKYNYFRCMVKDIESWLAEHDDIKPFDVGFDYLYDRMFVDDSITGNASGSYFFSVWKAEEAICHNLDLFQAACDEFYGDSVPTEHLYDAEWIDVTIRCYLLSSCLAAVLDGIEEDVEDFTDIRDNYLEMCEIY